MNFGVGGEVVWVFGLRLMGSAQIFWASLARTNAIRPYDNAVRCFVFSPIALLPTPYSLFPSQVNFTKHYTVQTFFAMVTKPLERWPSG